MRLLGLILIGLGAIVLAYQGFTYVTHETIVDAGPVKISADRERTVWVPPVIGGVAVIAGVALILSARRGDT